jgi:hypothetical protein
VNTFHRRRVLAAITTLLAALSGTTFAWADKADLFAPGTISDSRWQYRITFASEESVAYYTVADSYFPQTRRATIYSVAREADGTWSTPVVAPFSGTYTEIDPFITPDGRRLFFSSIRPRDGAPRAALDLFVMERTNDGWGDPVRLGLEVNSEGDELYASMDTTGTLYFASGPGAPTPDANWNLYHARPAGDGYWPRVALDDINTRLPWDPDAPLSVWEFNPEISPDGNTVLFASLRPGGYGHGDLHFSQRVGTGWSEPVNLGPAVNTEHDEFHPTLSRDGQWLYFARTIVAPQVVPSNFYRVPTSALPFAQSPPQEPTEPPASGMSVPLSGTADLRR